MELIDNSAFLAWAKGRQIAPDERYHEPRCLVYVPYRRFDRFWEIPARPAAWPFFVHRILDGLAPWRAGYLWPRGGQADRLGDSANPDEAVRRVALKLAGIPVGFSGAVRFEASELGELLTLLFMQMAFGWCTSDDLFLVPENGLQIVWFDHHDVVHVSFAEAERVEPFVQHMAEAGFELPTELPDATIKRPDWMDESSD